MSELKITKFKKSRSANPVANFFGNSWDKTLNWLQGLGKTLQFPIAVLPFAAILNRFGSLGITFTTHNGDITNAVGYWISFIIQTPGGVIFTNLPLFFAIGVGFGLAKDNRGEAALAAIAFYLVNLGFTAEHTLPQLFYGHVMTFGFQGKEYSRLFYLPKEDAQGNITGVQYILNIGVVGGIVAGAVTAVLYNKYKNITLPQWLSFFSGRRFVPMLAITVAVPISFIYAIIWPWIQLGLTNFGHSISGGNATDYGKIFGAFGYGIINRLLLPFGLHQILNTFLWFQLPVTGAVVAPWTGTIGPMQTINGDINAFTGTGSGGLFGSGNFQSGFFPIMMGGLPAAVIAMIFLARKENRVSVASFLGGAALISLLTGITEPIEFTFVFLSPLLWVAHAFLTGIFNAIVIAMHIHVGFGFSAGLIDYLVSFAQAWGFSHAEGAINGGGYGVLSNPLWILPMAVLCFIAYFVVFTFIIRKTDILTPGREEDYVAPMKVTKTSSEPTPTTTKKAPVNKRAAEFAQKATLIVEGIGRDNIITASNCATRLRVDVKDNRNIDEAKIKASGAFGIKRLGTNNVQIVFGPDAEFVTDAVNEILNNRAGS